MSLFLDEILTKLHLTKENKNPSFPRRREFRSKGIDSCFRRNDREYMVFPYRTEHNSGFTLIEVLIAVVILSIVLAAIYSTFFLSYRAVEGMDESMVKLQESREAIDILRRELDAAFYSGIDGNTFLKVQDRDIYGKQTAQLTFTAFSPLRPGLSRISYYIEDKDGKLNLFKKIESPYTNDKTEGFNIIEDIEAFSVETLYGDRWVKTWDTDISKSIPDEIRINLSVIINRNKMTLFDVARPRVGRPA
jgi:general secretion pathway protein J